MDAVELLLTRASNGKLSEPAPDAETLRIAFAAAVRAPDHGTLRPWRFLLIRGSARERLGEVLRAALLRQKPDATPEELDKAGRKPSRAPLIIVVAARIREHPKAPEIEQVLSAGAAAHGLLLALHARGFAGMWRTGPAAYDPEVKRALGLAASDAIAGFIYAGTASQPAPAIARPEPQAFVEEWTG